jgi:quinol monooxygenase YgiN
MTSAVTTTRQSVFLKAAGDGTTMLSVTLLFKCNPGMGVGLLEAFTATLGDTRKFDGCVSVKTYVDADNPDTVMLFEEWDSRAQQEAYLAWRVGSGMLEMLAPVLAAPLEMHYFESHPA